MGGGKIISLPSQTFTSLSSLLLGTFLFYTTSLTIERLLSSRRYALFLIMTQTASVIWKFAFGLGSFVEVVGGPHSILFSTMVIYYYHVPEIHVSHVLNSPGLGYSEKLMVYLLATQVAFHDGLGSFWGAALGVVAGGAYCSEPGGVLRDYEVPRSLANLVWSMGGWLLEEEDARLAGAGVGGGGGGNIMEQQRRMMEQYGGFGGVGGARVGGRGFGGRGTQAAAPAPPAPAPQQQFEPLPQTPEPPEEAIENLMALGFEREAVVAALAGCDNNVEVAANRLMG
ncbi:hypothetical protein TrVE_jg13783 [Triparma verrucosa]|uniref:UBA domain-containing protein n=1 Tax=Triparma verrucosa TaxID=1606542 RepID=A0A9W7C8L3_9STRA|nr:hypothetical protein TrVE_jg13783 [Triparma verrucosa]